MVNRDGISLSEIVVVKRLNGAAIPQDRPGRGRRLVIKRDQLLFTT